MPENMRRLHPRGAANRGICVDAEGAVLGPRCVLVHREPTGYRTVDRDDAADIQKCILGTDHERNWLFSQCQHIADALNKGEIALAQIYGLRIPIAELDDRQLRRVAAVRLVKTGFNPDEPRLPKGDPHGGEWTAGDSGTTAPTELSPPTRLLADLVGGDAAGAGSTATAAAPAGPASTGGGSQLTSASAWPGMRYQVIPPRGAGADHPAAEARDFAGNSDTLDSSDLQSDPTTLDSPDRQLPDVSVVADAADNSILTTPGIDAINPDDLFFLLATGGAGGW